MAIAHFSISSKALGRGTRISVILPADQAWYRDDPRPLKTLILLHGLTGDEDNWLNYTNAARLVREKPLCVIMPDGDNSFYTDSAVMGEKTMTFIGEELPGLFRAMLPLSEKREDTFIAGLSMGGFGAINCALTYPGTFSHAAMYSAALIKDRVLRGDPASGKHYRALFDIKSAKAFEGCPVDYEALAGRLAASGGPKPRIYTTCGTEDSLYPPNEAFAAKLKELGYDVTWESRPGSHTWDFWEESLKRTLDWLPL